MEVFILFLLLQSVYPGLGSVIVASNPSRQHKRTITDTLTRTLTPCPCETTAPTSTSASQFSESTDPGNAGICGQTNKTLAWDEFGLGEYLKKEAAEVVYFRQSPLQTFVNKSQHLSTLSYSCNFQEQCDSSLPLEYCLDDPFAMLTVSAMANFNNFFRDVAALVQKAKDNLDVGTLAIAFVPPPTASTEPVSAQQTAGFAIAVAGILIGVAAAIPGLEEFAVLGIAGVSAAVSIAGAALSTFQQTSSDPSIENEFNLFASVSASMNALDNQIQVRLQSFVDNATNRPYPILPGIGLNPLYAGTIYEDDPTQAPSLLGNGTYAVPLPDIPESVAGPTGTLAAAFAAPAINYFWQSARTVVVKASVHSLSKDPCQGDNFFPKNNKYCDNEGNMFVLVSLPAEPDLASFGSTDALNPPGFYNISNFGLNVETITTAAYNNQLANGINSNGSSSNFVSAVAAMDPRDIQLSDLVFFNLPVCFLDQVPQLTTPQELFCTFAGPSEPLDDICLFLMQTFCGCPYMPNWPYSGQSIENFCGPDGPPPDGST